MHMLRRRLGDQALACCTILCSRYRFKAMSTDDFRKMAAQYLPPGSPDPKLENFFDQWVESTGIPTLSLHEKISGRAPDVDLQLTLAQSDVGGETSIQVPIEVTYPGNTKKEVHWMRTSDEPVSQTLRLTRVPASVRIQRESVLAVVR